MYIDIISHVNRARRCAGADPLCTSPDLVLSAGAHAREAANQDAPLLVSEGMREMRVFRESEIMRIAVAVPKDARPEEVVDFLFSDYYNRRILVSCDAALMGAAVARASDNHSYVVVHLAAYNPHVSVFCSPMPNDRCKAKD